MVAVRSSVLCMRLGLVGAGSCDPVLALEQIVAGKVHRHLLDGPDVDRRLGRHGLTVLCPGSVEMEWLSPMALQSQNDIVSLLDVIEGFDHKTFPGLVP